MAQHISERAANAAAPAQVASNAAARLATISRYIALTAAWVAMCGSLFFSEALGWQPCQLCWYQRILMYPLAGILTMGVLRRDEELPAYVLPFSLFGAGMSLYHYLLVKTDWLPIPACHTGVPCTVDYLNWLGFINIPFLALTAFVIISAMAFVMIRHPLEYAEDEEEDSAPAFSLADAAVFGIIGAVVLGFIVAAKLV